MYNNTYYFIDLGTKKNGAQSIIPVFITIDPARDTIGQLKYYSRDFDPRFTWLTGTIEQLQTVAKAFRVYIGKVNTSLLRCSHVHCLYLGH